MKKKKKLDLSKYHYLEIETDIEEGQAQLIVNQEGDCTSIPCKKCLFRKENTSPSICGVMESERITILNVFTIKSEKVRILNKMGYK